MEIDDELEAEIERIVDERVEKQLMRLLGAKNASADATEASSGVSTARRRNMLKALGIGAAGFGAGVLPCVGGEVQPVPAEQAQEGGAGQGGHSEGQGTTPNRTDRDESNSTKEAGIEAFERNIGLIAQPGEIQSKVDEAATDPSNGRVALRPGIEYDPGSEIHVKKNVTFDFNGGRIVQTTDHNTLFVDHGARVQSGLIDRSALGDSASSTAVLLDAGRAGNDYRNAAGDYTGASVDCNVLGAGADSKDVGLQLVGKDDLGIDLGNEFDMQIRDCGKGLDVYTERYLNGPVFQLGLTGNRIGIDHRGTDIFNSTVYGWIQPELGSEVGIRNQTGNRSVMFIGEFWDPTRYDRYSLEGPAITVLSVASDALQFEGTTDEDNYTAVQSWDDERRAVYNAESNSTFEAKFDAGIMQYRVNGNRIMDVSENYVRINGEFRR